MYKTKICLRSAYILLPLMLRWREKWLSFKKRLEIIAIGVAFCIVGAIPLFLLSSIETEEMLQMAGLICLLMMVAAGVFLLTSAGFRKGAYDQLLQVGDFTREEKKAGKIIDKIAMVYWCIVTVLYVGWSLLTWNWHITWILWPVAGIFFGGIAGFVKMRQK